MEYLVFGIFIAVLLTCVFIQTSLILPLAIGYLLFFFYGLYKGISAKELLLVSWQKIRSIGTILIVFTLIGSLTAVWRASGTIAIIIDSTSSFLHPSYFVLITFLLCCILSMLIGTAYGTAATMGVICMSIGRVLNIDPAFLGGAILAGSYFGDRMSPMSTTVFLVSMVTKTDLYSNVKRCFTSTTVPIIASCVFYYILGQSVKADVLDMQMLEIFERNFNLHWLDFMPAISTILLAFFKVNVKNIMLVSTIIGSFVCLYVQNMSLYDLANTLIFGYTTDDKMLRPLLNGGGIVSMLSVAVIVAISSSYAGLFETTKILDGIKDKIGLMSNKFGSFIAMLCTSILTSAIACNQILSIMLTADLCKDNYEKVEDMTIPLENSAMVIPVLIPWSITCTVPFASVDAPTTSLFFACFLYFVPLWAVILDIKKRKFEKAAF